MSTVFPKWSNNVPMQLGLVLVVIGALLVVGITYYFTPKYTRVGYAPVQPVPFDHNLHSGQLGIDCRYCHSFVEVSPHASVPSAATCMSCHSQIKPDSPALAPVRASYENGEPLPWVRVHESPDYVFFDHSAHVTRGVSCYECHGQVNEMQVVYHAKFHSMGFCLDCHRNPERFIRPPEEVFNLDWHPASAEEQLEIGGRLVREMNINPTESCSACHR